MIELEQKYFGKNVATYFVQWNFIGSTDYEKNYELDGAKEYDKFIFHKDVFQTDPVDFLGYYTGTKRPTFTRASFFSTFLLVPSYVLNFFLLIPLVFPLLLHRYI